LFWNIIWLILILNTLLPFVRQRQIEEKRFKLIKEIEKKRSSRVITLIHRQESLSLLGLPISRFINIEDSEQVLRAVRMTPDDMPIDIILHTPGGLVLAAEQIAHAIMRHPAKVTVFVPHYAMSGGTMIALAADEIIMDENAVLGPVDPQLGNYPAASILRVLAQKPIEKIDDETLILADVAEKAMYQVKENVYRILKENMDDEKAIELAKIFTEGRWTHDYPISAEQLKDLGLFVSTDLPKEIYSLMALYPQTNQMRPSVHFVPMPYQNKKNDKN
jgi:ClpP class serine protease